MNNIISYLKHPPRVPQMLELVHSHGFHWVFPQHFHVMYELRLVSTRKDEPQYVQMFGTIK